MLIDIPSNFYNLLPLKQQITSHCHTTKIDYMETIHIYYTRLNMVM